MKDRGKNHLNSKTNSLKPDENDAGWFHQFLVRPVLRKKSYLLILTSDWNELAGIEKFI
jgi:hypothetical protein